MRLTLLSVLALATSSAAAAQSAVPSAPTAVLVVGTIHLANPGTDRNNVQTDNVHAPRRQAEIVAVVDALAAFQPTHIAIELPFAADSAFNASYGRYLAGTDTLRSNEVDQFGFRLAQRAGHARLWGVDSQQGMDFDAVVASAQNHGQQGRLAEGDSAVAGVVRGLQRVLAAGTVGDLLRFTNGPAFDGAHASYLLMAGIGGGGDYAGADLAAGWYARNLRIFANVDRVAGPGDRVLLLIGAGHARVLREFFAASPAFALADVADFLPPAGYRGAAVPAE